MGEAAVAVLRGRDEIEDARRTLDARGLMHEPPLGARVGSALRRLVRRPDSADALRPDPIKSWDVLRTVEAVSAAVRTGEPVLDVGSVASGVPIALSRLGFERVHAIDLDPQILDMPADPSVEYVVGDLMQTDWPDGHFGAITAISVIEHGFDRERLVAEVARLLRAGGLFVFSTDYWPDKIDTSDTPLFDLPWTIFSRDEVEELVAAAGRHGLVPAGPMPDDLVAPVAAPIRYAGREYTFLWAALARSTS